MHYFRQESVLHNMPDSVFLSLINFQAWLNHNQLLEAEVSTCAAKELARRLGGDPSSADWRHFGRLAGFH